MRSADLRNIVGEFGAICLKQSLYHPGLDRSDTRVSDLFMIEGKAKQETQRVVRRPDAIHQPLQFP